MIQALQDILTFFANSFFGSLAIGAVCPLLGVYFVLRRMAFLGVAVPQFSAAGMALGFLLLDPWLNLIAHDHGGEEVTGHFTFFLLVSLVFTFSTLLVLVWLNRRGGGAPEGRIAVGYSLAAAATILCLANSSLGQGHLNVLLRGEILTIDTRELVTIALVYGGVLALFFAFRRELLLVAFDPEAAISLGMKPPLWDALFYLLAGSAISVGVMTVGPLVIFGLLVIPPMAARPLARNMTTFYWLSALLGMLSAFIGFLASYMLDWPLGPTDVVASFTILLVIRFLVTAKNAFDRVQR